MDPITRKLVETVRQITEGHTPDTKRVVIEPRKPAIFYDYTQKLSERPRWEKVAADMGIDSSGIEQMSSQVHDEWMKRNPKADWNAAQHVPYEQLPESEKVKDREHVQQILVLHRENVAEPNTSLETHIDRLANAFGAQAHETWRAGWQEKNDKNTPRMKSVSGGTQVNINVPWKDLHPEWKRENYQAGVAAARALYNAPSPSGKTTSELSESGWDSLSFAPIQKKGKYSDGSTGLPGTGQKVDQYGNIVRDRKPGVIVDGPPSASTGYDARGVATPPYNPNKSSTKNRTAEKGSLWPSTDKFPVQGNDGY